MFNRRNNTEDPYRETKTAVFFTMIFTVVKWFLIGVGISYLIYVGKGYIKDKFVHKQETPEEYVVEIDDQTIAKNRDTLKLLRDECWPNLSEQEKINVLQRIADIERNYLGIPYELHLEVEDLSGIVKAYYSESDHGIYVKRDLLSTDTVNNLLDSVIHECYHAYQQALVSLYQASDPSMKKLLVFKDVNKYAEEFKDYISGSEGNLEEYMGQMLERNSRQYAKDSLPDYMNVIDNCFIADSDGVVLSVDELLSKCDVFLDMYSDPDSVRYMQFDMDGDDTPEIACADGTSGSSEVAVFRLDSNNELQYIDSFGSYGFVDILPTKSIFYGAYSGEGLYEVFSGIDENYKKKNIEAFYYEITPETEGDSTKYYSVEDIEVDFISNKPSELKQISETVYNRHVGNLKKHSEKWVALDYDDMVRYVNPQ